MAFAALDDAEKACKLFRLIHPVNHANSADAKLTVDGIEQSGTACSLVDDRAQHYVELTVCGAPA